MGFFRAVARRPVIIAGLLIFLAGAVASGAKASPRADSARSPSGVSARRSVFKDQGELDRIARADVSEPLRLFVQLRSSPLSDLPGLRQERLLEAEHRAFRTRMRRAGIPFRELSSHRRLFNGLSVEVPAGQAGRIAGLRGVAGLFLVRSSDMPRPHLSSSVPMVGAPRAWAGDPERAIPGVDGTGVTVAVIDTGMSFRHPT